MVKKKAKKKPVKKKPAKKKVVKKVKCAAKTRDGKRCKNFASKGMYCKVHQSASSRGPKKKAVKKTVKKTVKKNAKKKTTKRRKK